MIDLSRGYQIISFPAIQTLPHLHHWIEQENWYAVDEAFKALTKKEGELFKLLHQFCDFETIEFIISIRDAHNPDEEDGIWHDDGSRKLAFSLSLTKHEIQGGILEIKHQSGNPHHHLSTPRFGEMIVFLTGISGYYHKINKVTKGKRIIVAGWCS